MAVKVQSVNELKRERSSIKNAYGSVVTNFTALPKEYEVWIKNGSLYQVVYDRVSYFIHQTARSNEVYFFADNYKSVRASLSELKKCLEKDSVIEILQRDDTAFLGSSTMVLQRMSSTVIPKVDPVTLTDIVPASLEELQDIEEILLEYFDPIAERVPTVSQLGSLLDDPKSGGLCISKDQDRITGLMIYGIDKTTIHLRYWWTHPSYRNQGIGSRLLSRFFYMGADCQRMILWVRTDNEEAINRYRHFGFLPEQMYDYIYKIK